MNDDHRTTGSLPPESGTELTHYHLGRTAIFAARVDPRCSWCAYVPRGYDPEGSDRYPLAVVLHGTDRDVLGCRDRFADWAEESQCVVLSPLFPAGLAGARDLDNYKWVSHRGVRFDHILLGMVDELRHLYRIDGDRFLLHGFSGGGHFAHRFYYLHPHRLRGVSVGAPGVVTLLDPDRDYWAGTRGMERWFGTTVDLDALRRVPVHLVVGQDDVETREITLEPGSPWWLDGIDETGVNRVQRMQALERSLLAHRIEVRFDLVPGVGHDGFRVLEPVRDFFGSVLGRATAEGPGL